MFPFESIVESPPFINQVPLRQEILLAHDGVVEPKVTLIKIQSVVEDES